MLKLVMPTNWNPQTRKFERDGKPIPPSAVRRFVADTVESAKSRMETIAKDYTNSRNTAALYTSMKEEIRNMHSALAMVAQGGREQMDTKAWGRVGQKVKSELEYLRGFERDVANGLQSDAQILARAIKYASAAYITYEQSVFNREKESGIEYVEWIVDESAENCAGCLDAAGIHPIDKAPVIGSHECQNGCRCSIEYLDNEDVARAA